MNDPPPFASALARVLDREKADVAVSPADRDGTIAEMARRLRERRRRRALAPWLGLSAAAAAVLVVGLAHRRPHDEHVATAAPPAAPIVAEDVSGSALVVVNGHTNPIHEGMALATGDHILTLLDGGVTIALATGTRLAVEGGGDVGILSHGATQLFELESGAVRADVAKLGPDQRFVIRTGDAEVEVRGTSFRVATAPPDPSCGQRTKTRVHVYEGVVTVRTGGAAAVAIHPGESWPASCAAAPEALGADPIPSAPSTAAPPAPSARTPAVPVHSRAASSDLVAENDLFDVAMSAKRRGDAASAVTALDHLLARYPQCPFAESATLERVRLLAGLDRGRAADAAREYLRRYPNGFGRAEAQALTH